LHRYKLRAQVISRLGEILGVDRRERFVRHDKKAQCSVYLPTCPIEAAKSQHKDFGAIALRLKTKCHWDLEINYNYQLPITNYQLPISNYQLANTNYQLAITNYQLPITNYQYQGVLLCATKLN